MTDYLVALQSVHVTAAACDFLSARLDDGDGVVLLSVLEEGTDDRDAGDALNVGVVRLGPRAEVGTETREGDPAGEILSAAGEHGSDVIVIGPWEGTPGTLGGTARAVVEGAGRPVVVVPPPAPG